MRTKDQQYVTKGVPIDDRKAKHKQVERYVPENQKKSKKAPAIAKTNEQCYQASITGYATSYGNK